MSRCGYWDRGEQCPRTDAEWSTDDAHCVLGPCAYGTVMLCEDHCREFLRDTFARIDGPELTEDP